MNSAWIGHIDLHSSDRKRSAGGPSIFKTESIIGGCRKNENNQNIFPANQCYIDLNSKH